MQVIPDPALVVLIGPSGAGKSTWAAQHYREQEVVSSDRLRGIVGSGDHDLDASTEAFALLDQIVEARVRRRLTTVVDTLGFDDERRRRQLDLAKELGLPAVAVVFNESAEVCRKRNRERARPVPAAVLTGQFRRLRQIDLSNEGWDLVVAPEPSRVSTVAQPTPEAPAGELVRGGFYLHLSRFPKDQPLGPWLADVAGVAEQVGFRGLSLMDHLIQIPQVGREWEPLPEAYTALSFLAGVTSGLELGALVTAVRLRNPALLAKMVATLDVVSGGRVFCGIGAGWFDEELVAYGFEPGNDRFIRLEESIQILRRMWSPGKASFEGQTLTVREAVAYPKPVHPIRIIVGGNGRRTRAIALRHADGLNLVGVNNLEQQLENLKSELALAGRQEGFSISVLDTPLIGADREVVAGMVERWRGNRPAATFARTHRAGTVADHVESYRRLIAAGCDSFFVAPVGLSEPDQLAPWGSLIEEFS
jgi:alkanesulfonate monooxygenase SsuD/methylene tetrahydromethanopterin reductase-like flavin-dependent oxidoreductase (luciferase family)/predicted kinase